MNRFKRLCAVLLAALAPLAVPPAAALDPVAVLPAQPALWKIADADTTIWLFGTVHALPAGIDWFTGPVAEAFEGSHEVVTEIAETEPAQMQNIVLTKALMPKGQTLRSVLSPELRSAYEARVVSLGLPVGVFDAFEPWYVAIALAALPLQNGGFEADHGVEYALDKRARAKGLPRSALETAGFQLGLFDALPMETQKRYLGEVVRDLDQMPAQLRTMIAAWKSGNSDQLAALMNQDTSEPELMRVLLTDRNRTWSQWIAQRLDRPGIVFLAVGAGHLAGADSVQQFLAQKGISTARIQ